MNTEENKIPDVLEEYFNQVEREIEAINEVTIIKEDGLKISLEPNGETDRGWGYDPYFKVFRGNDRSHVARIYITRAQYCKPHSGSRTIILSSNERDKMIKLLSKNEYKNWKKMLKETNNYMVSNNLETFPLDLEMPDYSKL